MASHNLPKNICANISSDGAQIRQPLPHTPHPAHQQPPVHAPRPAHHNLPDLHVEIAKDGKFVQPKESGESPGKCPSDCPISVRPSLQLPDVRPRIHSTVIAITSPFSDVLANISKDGAQIRQTPPYTPQPAHQQPPVHARRPVHQKLYDLQDHKIVLPAESAERQSQGKQHSNSSVSLTSLLERYEGRPRMPSGKVSLSTPKDVLGGLADREGEKRRLNGDQDGPPNKILSRQNDTGTPGSTSIDCVMTEIPIDAIMKHNELSIILDRLITADSFRCIKQMALTYRDWKIVEKAQNIRDLWFHLEVQGLIGVGKYDNLMKIMTDAGVRIAMNEIFRTVNNIEDIMHKHIPTRKQSAISSLGAESPLMHETLPMKKNDQVLLGRGAFGEVYKRHDDRWNTTIAVKSVKTCGLKTGNENLGSLRNEIKILGKLNHPRVIKLLGFEEMTTCIEIFLEYMPNGSVKDYMLKHKKPFCERSTAKLTRHVLEGIIYLHDNTILHRDIKGSNVLLDHQMNAKLGDFGISKQIQTLTNSNRWCNTHVGTPYWMSPERIRGEGYGKKADIWGIGCTVIEMLTMHPPWHEFETTAAIFKIGIGMYPIYQLPPEVSTQLQDFLSQIFRQNAAERPKATELWNHPFLHQTTHLDTFVPRTMQA